MTRDEIVAAVKKRQERREGRAPAPAAPETVLRTTTTGNGNPPDLRAQVKRALAAGKVGCADVGQELAPQIAGKTALANELAREVIQVCIQRLAEPAARDSRATGELQRLVYGRELLHVYFDPTRQSLLIAERLLEAPRLLPAPDPEGSTHLLHGLIPETEAGADPDKLEGFLRRAAAVIPASAVKLIATLNPIITMAPPDAILPHTAQRCGRAFVSFWWALGDHEPGGRYAPGVNELTLSASLGTSGRDGANAAVYGLMGALDYALGEEGRCLSSSPAWQTIWLKASHQNHQPLGARTDREMFAKVATALLMPLSPGSRDIPLVTTRARLLRECREAHDFVLDALARRVPQKLSQGGAQSPASVRSGQEAHLHQARQAAMRSPSGGAWLQVANAQYALGALDRDDNLLRLAEQSVDAYAASTDSDVSTSDKLRSSIARTRAFQRGSMPLPTREAPEQLSAELSDIVLDFRIGRVAAHFHIPHDKTGVLREHPERLEAAEKIMNEEAETRTRRLRQQTLRPGPSIGDTVTGLVGEVTGQETLGGEPHVRMRVIPPLFVYNEKRDKRFFPYGEAKRLEDTGRPYANAFYRWRAEADLDDYVHSAFTLYVRTQQSVPEGSRMTVDGVVRVLDATASADGAAQLDVRGTERPPDKLLVIDATRIEREADGRAQESEKQFR